eukprot:CAMPEP_0202686108 /NCGR_PEP_ID=MMETSP1385-20130828/1908_1 /ASSEMBLY_ACC=CAM_ASM_000861 /TAXON_ID=933848 /ORGANISM="Elphidium margaritaceum" /LENGTH=468 /DNA_ID=CAMNT_0049340623 /DNA_START=211 /DNA_END=1617 /DNA_ORIENTATION=+
MDIEHQERRRSSLYVRRQNNQRQPLQVKVDADNHASSSAELYSAQSFATCNELSSASSVRSSGVNTGYLSNSSRSCSDLMLSSNASDSSIDQKKPTFLKKLSKFVRGAQKQKVKQKQKQKLKQKPKKKNANDELDDLKMDVEYAEDMTYPPAEEEEEQRNDDDDDICDIYTPSTGNTPLIKRTTPLTTPQTLTSEMIEAMIGVDTFMSDYLRGLFEEEKMCNSMQWYRANRMQSFLERRDAMIDWLCTVGMSCELQRLTIYRAIYYFDKLCSIKEVHLAHLQIIAANCLLIAVKWTEKEEKVPSLYQLSKACNKKYTPHQLKSMEIRICELLAFQLKIVLPLDFIEYYIDEGCVFADDMLGHMTNLHLNAQSNVYMKKYVTFFLDIISQNYCFWQFLPSILGMAVIIASRRALKIEPYFSRKLVAVCKYEPTEILRCFTCVWTEFKHKFPNDASAAEMVQPHDLQQFM